jgi:hypothetical protein
MITENNVIISKVLVFKTNISSDEDINSVTKILALENKIFRWNVDRADIDNVLRIEGSGIAPKYVINLFRAAGFHCEELPD